MPTYPRLGSPFPLALQPSVAHPYRPEPPLPVQDEEEEDRQINTNDKPRPRTHDDLPTIRWIIRCHQGLR